jgi:hypothetical protein
MEIVHAEQAPHQYLQNITENDDNLLYAKIPLGS